jgi:hypothetical protein
MKSAVPLQTSELNPDILLDAQQDDQYSGGRKSFKKVISKLQGRNLND